MGSLMSESASAADGDPNLQAYELRCQAHTFGLLARFWIRELDDAILNELQDEPMRDAYRDVGGFVPETQGHDASNLVEALAVEFKNSFDRSQNELRPHQSTFEDRRFDGNCLESMRAFVEVIGQPVGLFADEGKLDHAGVQLHLMQRILNEMADIVQQQISESSQAVDSNWESFVQLRDTFYENHLCWLIPYCEKALQESNSQFYRGLFSVTYLLLGGE